VLLKKKEKHELKIPTRVKTMNWQSSLSDAQSTKSIAAASFTRLRH
jgi:hypothetical protein